MSQILPFWHPKVFKKIVIKPQNLPNSKDTYPDFQKPKSTCTRIWRCSAALSIRDKACWWTTTQYVTSWGLTGSMELAGVNINKTYFSWSWQIQIYWRVLVFDEYQCVISIKSPFKVDLTVKQTRSSFFPSISIMHSGITWREKLRMGENVGEQFLKTIIVF